MTEATNRRGVLRSILAIGAVVTAPAAAAVTRVPEGTDAPTKRPDEAKDLIEVGQRLTQLLGDRQQALAEKRSAGDRFNATAPLPPKPRKRKTARIFKQPMFRIERVDSRSSAKRILRDAG